MAAIAQEAGVLPLFQTELGPSQTNGFGMFNLAWLIQNAVTIEGVSAYLHWDLIWGNELSSATPQGLVSLESADSMARWTTPRGYRINDTYYAVRHFAKWIDAGWQRIEATAASSVIRASAFAAPDGQRVTVVLINTDDHAHDVTLDGGSFSFGTSTIYRTSGTSERTAEVGPLTDGTTVSMPARSIATLTLGP
jgi:O-glycosyl hydrolase